MYMRSPDVSIVITNYNYGKFLARCVRSCLAQKSVNVEVIVVDDCSTDNSLKTLKTFKNDVKIIANKENVGVAVAANMGIEAAKSQFVIRVDADDFVNADMCYIMSKYLISNHDAFCVSCDYFMVDEHENILERKYAEKNNISCGIMYRRDLLLEMGGYNPKMRHREEEELRKRLSEYYKIHHLKFPFYRYRMHNFNKTKEPEYKTWEI
tara:strand:+ start:487 stop:1113 length:627 start_codon:yes stop_codon:yes gene_type:complete